MTKRSLLRLKLLALARFIAIGTAVGTVFGYVNYLIVDAQPLATVGGGVLAGLMIGASVGGVEVYAFFGRMRRARVEKLLLLRVLVCASSFVIWLSIGNAFRIAEAQRISLIDAAVWYGLQDTFVRDFLFTVVAAIVFVWILQAAQLQRARDVFNFILGRYHRPQEVERAFLFVDVTGSTTLAEELGHLTYSAFLQDFFFDVDMAALATRGEIYQYVGDEVVVSWPLGAPAERGRCIECCFALLDIVESRKDRYIEEYGTFPRFKAGLHGGKAVVSRVGETKKEIVYHGDVLNTAARIQVESKQSPYECLISEELLRRLVLPEGVEAELVGEVDLRGKEAATALFGLARKEEQIGRAGLGQTER